VFDANLFLSAVAGKKKIYKFMDVSFPLGLAMMMSFFVFI